jgi:hypothetical protein
MDEPVGLEKSDLLLSLFHIADWFVNRWLDIGNPKARA